MIPAEWSARALTLKHVLAGSLSEAIAERGWCPRRGHLLGARAIQLRPLGTAREGASQAGAAPRYRSGCVTRPNLYDAQHCDLAPPRVCPRQGEHELGGGKGKEVQTITTPRATQANHAALARCLSLVSLSICGRASTDGLNTRVCREIRLNSASFRCRNFGLGREADEVVLRLAGSCDQRTWRAEA